MRVVTFHEFTELPVGTIYAEYFPHALEKICIKRANITYDNKDRSFPDRGKEFVSDFWLSDIGVSLMGQREYSEYIYNDSNPSDKHNVNGFTLCDTIERWGSYDETELFLVYSDEDVEVLIKQLQDRKIDVMESYK